MCYPALSYNLCSGELRHCSHSILYTNLRGRQEAEVDRESIQVLLDELEQAALIQDYTRAKMESWERFRQIAGRIVAGIHHAINGPDSGAGGFIDRN